MEKDLIITGGVEKINSLLEQLEANKPEAYAYKTNCRFEDKNIKTLTEKDLVKIVGEVLVAKETSEKAQDYLKDAGISITHETDLFGFSHKDWLDDLTFQIKKLSWNSQKKTLEAKKSALENFYSQEHKDNQAIQELLKGLV